MQVNLIDLIREIRGRPVLIAALGIIAGIAASTDWRRCLYGIIAIVLLQQPRRRLLFCGFWIVGLILAPSPGATLKEPIFLAESGIVVSVPKLLSEGQRFVWEGKSGRFDVIEIGGNRDVAFGDRLELNSVANPPSFEMVPYYQLNRLQGKIQTRSKLIQESEYVGATQAMQVRRNFITWADARFSKDHASLLEAMCLGTDSRLTPTQWSQLRDSGTIHIVSASGFQVSLIATAITLLLSRFPIPRWSLVLCLGMMLWLYALMAGFNAPILRSSIMAMVPIIAYLFRRDGDLLSSLALSAIALILWRPQTVFEPGFQFSFIAVAGLGLFADASEGESGVSQLICGVRASVVATIVTMPLLLYHFGSAPLVGVIANLFISLPAGASVVLGLLQFVLSSLGLVGLEFVSVPILSGLLGFCEWVVRCSSEVPLGRITVNGLSEDLAAALLVAFFSVWRFRRLAAD
jgi:competence protein ComEC